METATTVTRAIGVAEFCEHSSEDEVTAQFAPAGLREGAVIKRFEVPEELLQKTLSVEHLEDMSNELRECKESESIFAMGTEELEIYIDDSAFYE